MTMIQCTKCQGYGWYFKSGLLAFCKKCEGEGAVEATIFHPVAEYFLFSQPWRWLLLRVTDYLPEEWSKRLCERLYPSEPKLCRDCIYFEGCSEGTAYSGAARCDYWDDVSKEEAQ